MTFNELTQKIQDPDLLPRCGIDSEFRLHPSEEVCFERCQSQRYYDSQYGPNVEKAYWAYCEAARKPAVIVRRKQGKSTADIILDMDPSCRALLRKAHDKLAVLFECEGQSIDQPDNTVAGDFYYLPNVQCDRACDVAAQIAKIALQRN